MKLKKFSFEKFRSIYESIEIPIHNISVFIGQNGGGKTATFDALDIFLKKDKKIDKNDINDKINNKENLEIHFWGEFELNEEEKNFFKKIDENIENKIKIYKRFLFKDDQDSSDYFIKAYGTGTELDNLDLGKIREPYEKLCEKFGINYGEGKKKLNISQMKDKLCKVRDNLPKNRKIEKRLRNDDINKLFPEFILFSSEKSEDPKNKMIEILRNTLKEQIKDLNLKNEIETITNVIQDVCIEKINEADKILKKYCPSIEKINVNPEYDPIRGLILTDFDIIKKGNIKVKFESEATGRRRQIMLGLYEWSNLQITNEIKKNFIFAFDEPDLHFDYFQISNLLRILKEFSEKDNVQVLIATHSLKIIETFPPNNIIHYKLLNDETTVIEFLSDEKYDEIKDFLQKISYTLGFRSAFLFFEKAFVITEGPSEYSALPILFKLVNERTPIEAGITFINGDNNDQAVKFGKYLMDNFKKVVIIVDKDVKKNKKFKEENLRKLGFIKGTNLFYVGGENNDQGEFENEFNNEQWIQLLNNEFPRKGGEQWNVEDIAKLRENGKFSEKLIRKIEENYDGRISKPELNYKIACSIKNREDLSDNLKLILEELNKLND